MKMPARLRWIDSPLASRIFATALTLLASYFGYEKVEEYRAANKVQDLVITVEQKPAVPAAQHDHPHSHKAAPQPAHKHDPGITKADVKAVVDAAIAAQHGKDLHKFKKKEPWDNGG